MFGLRRLTWLAAGFATSLFLGPAPVCAYEGSTTLAGLTEQAALKSLLHRRLAGRFDLSLGLFEPLQLDLALLDEARARELFSRLSGLDAGQGHAPWVFPPEGGKTSPLKQTALGWLVAGAVLEQMPAQAVRNHFVDGKTGAGLSRPVGQTAASAAASAVEQRIATPRQLFAGAAMDGTGLSSVDWLASPDNSLGQNAFFAAYERRVTHPDPKVRQTALSLSLLSLGAMLAVLEQAGDPAFVHNDLASVLSADFSGYVSARYGRAGVPSPNESVEPPVRFADLLFEREGRKTGLAEQTASRFLSKSALGSLDVKTLLSGRFGVEGYLARQSIRHGIRWHLEPGGKTELTLDERCFAEHAAALLPKIGSYARAGLDFLLRGDLKMTLGPTGELSLTLLDQALGSGVLTVFGETAEGQRSELTKMATLPTRPGVLGVVSLADKIGPGHTRLVLFWKGQDRNGQPLFSSAQLHLKKKPAE